MRAAVYHGPGKPLEVTDLPAPTPQSGEVLVKIAACGLCHTDLHYIDHGVSTFKEPPLVLGHEPAGTVVEIGKGVSGHEIDERVVIPAVLSCGRCHYCRKGRENLCDNLVMLGNHVNGAYAEFIAVPAHELVRVPDSIPLEKACIIADAVSTPYHAVKHRGRVAPGDTVAVVGCGGVGLNVVQCALVAGANVIAVDVNDRRLAIAETLGADTLNPGSIDRVDKHVRKMTAGGVDVAFEAIGRPETVQLAFGLLRKGGRLCVIGFTQENVALSTAKIMFYELEVVGSLGCGAGEYPEIMSLVESGRIKLDLIVSGCIPLSDINDGLDRLRNGEGVRWVVTPS